MAIGGLPAMIANAVASFVAIQRASGFAYKTGGQLLESYARFAMERDTHVRTATAVEWAGLTTGRARQKERRLQAVIVFARHAHAEDSRHQIPPAGFYASSSQRRPTPFIFSPEEVRALLGAAGQLAPEGAYRPLLYRPFFGLLAGTGMRVSEA